MEAVLFVVLQGDRQDLLVTGLNVRKPVVRTSLDVYADHLDQVTLKKNVSRKLFLDELRNKSRIAPEWDLKILTHLLVLICFLDRGILNLAQLLSIQRNPGAVLKLLRCLLEKGGLKIDLLLDSRSILVTSVQDLAVLRKDICVERHTQYPIMIRTKVNKKRRPFPAAVSFSMNQCQSFRNDFFVFFVSVPISIFRGRSSSGITRSSLMARMPSSRSAPFT